MTTPSIDIYIGEEALRSRITILGAEITDAYRDSGRPLVLLVVLKGAMVFAGELMRHINLPLTFETIRLSSYGYGTASSGTVSMVGQEFLPSLRDVDVLVVEDIVDTGLSMLRLTRFLNEQKPASMRICTLLDKPARREVLLAPDYVGFTLPDDAFVVGYGMDLAEQYRHLPYVGIVRS
jgi:hypoxanthine phosphoribosyltransferase